MKGFSMRSALKKGGAQDTKPLFEITFCRGKEKECPFYLCDVAAMADNIKKLFEQIDFSGRLRKKMPGMILKHNIFQVALSGCPNACSQPQIKDIGIIAQSEVIQPESGCLGCGMCVNICPAISFKEKKEEGIVIDFAECVSCGLCTMVCPEGVIKKARTGYKIIIGGKLGRRPQLASTLFEFVPPEEELILGYISNLVEFYLENSKPREKMAVMLNRLGLETIKSAVLDM